jgi:hypothetical protein
MSNLQKLIDAGIPAKDSYIFGFAEGCYNMNTIDELLECLSKDADVTDCETWYMTVEEWNCGITQALSQMRFDLEQQEEV